MTRQYDDFQAAQLFCPKCKAARPVRPVLLLVLPGKNIYDYRCAQCGTRLGTREEADALAMKRGLAPHPAAPTTPQRRLPAQAGPQPGRLPRKRIP